MYTIVFSEDAKKEALPKLARLLDELREHPRTGTDQVEPLKGYDCSIYSRRITKEHRLVYRIYDDVVEVLVLSAFGHYK